MAVVVEEVDSATPRRVENPKRPNIFRRLRKHWADYFYVLPALGIMILVIGYPIYYTIYLSFFSTPPSLAMSDKIWVGLDNYKRILRSENFREVTKNTAV
ncbi:MAG: sugar ABC transporter permease, partial [Thermomicrobiales bacterium]